MGDVLARLARLRGWRTSVGGMEDMLAWVTC